MLEKANGGSSSDTKDGQDDFESDRDDARKPMARDEEKGDIRGRAKAIDRDAATEGVATKQRARRAQVLKSRTSRHTNERSAASGKLRADMRDSYTGPVSTTSSFGRTAVGKGDSGATTDTKGDVLRPKTCGKRGRAKERNGAVGSSGGKGVSEYGRKKAKPSYVAAHRNEDSTGSRRARKQDIAMEVGSSAANSPAVESYAPHEQKEIFEAVHSLQILAKTPTPEREVSNGAATAKPRAS